MPNAAERINKHKQQDRLPTSDSEAGLWGWDPRPTLPAGIPGAGWENGLVSPELHEQHSDFSVPSKAAQWAHFLLLQMGLRMNFCHKKERFEFSHCPYRGTGPVGSF